MSLLEIRKLSAHYGDFQALYEIDFRAKPRVERSPLLVPTVPQIHLSEVHLRGCAGQERQHCL